ncbi:MAG: hypothetical protein E4H27_05625 [Anaerolineales bacterium]|nr:MAG: hypothetical protein E4H27_05625 [Anaerolineales bacterium]
MIPEQVAYLTDESRRRTRDSLLIFTGALLLFTVGLNPEFIGFQARFGLFAQEIFRFGPSYFPTTYRSPYPDYPGTSIFLVYLVSKLVGQVTPFSAILPTAVTSALILVFTYRIGAIRSRRWGFAAVLLALFTAEFFNESRSIALDQYTSLATVLSFYLVYSATFYGRDKRLVLLPVVWFLSFAFRGHIGLVIPAAVVCSYYLWLAKYKRFILAGMVAAVVLALGFACLLLAAKLQGGESLVQSVLSAQMTGRMHDRGPGYAYYWLKDFTSYAPAYPLAIIVVISRFKDILGRKNDDDILLGSLACWILIVLVGMSIPSVKKARYILPIVPALSLAASYVLIDTTPKRILFEVKKICLSICSFLPLAGAVATLGILLFGKYFGLSFNAHFLFALVLMTGLVIIARILDKRLRGHHNRDMVTAAIGLSAFIIVNIGVAQPVDEILESTRPFVEKVKLLEKERPGDIVFYQIGHDTEDIKFMVNYDEPITPIFIKHSDELLKCPKNSYFITTKQSFDNLPDDLKKQIKLFINGRIGHRDSVVFTLE